ncbi:hypothetical protein SteCoe_18828 [Stentor coeruleus]|uniref:RING-type domain-containing protein n=1 Tax=Stentor coeruleus TaxID=5963 RepID=A0A1R2BVR7_9CILI|nr:hypothetical protein SteCoe_18828 [Stentor coeruleus]
MKYYVLLIIFEAAFSVYTEILENLPEDYVFYLNYSGIDERKFKQAYLSLMTKEIVSTLFVANAESAPEYDVKQEVWNITADLQDTYSWMSYGKDHFLNLESDKNWFIGIFTYGKSDSARWNFTVIETEQAECWGKCEQNGKCVDGNCECNSGFIGHDCQDYFYTVDSKSNYSFSIYPYTYIYMLGSPNEELECVFSKTTGFIKVYLINSLLTTGKLPGHIFYDEFLEEGFSKTTFKMRIPKSSSFSLISESEIVFSSIECKSYLSASNDRKALILGILIGIVGFVIISWIGYLCYKHCRSPRHYTQKIAPKNTSHDDTDIKEYSDLDRNEDEYCTICLEQFRKNTKIRQLDCGHIFHRECVDLWLRTNQYCCICKQNYLKKAAYFIPIPISAK